MGVVKPQREPPDAPADRVEHVRHFGVAAWDCRIVRKPARRSPAEDTGENQCVEVHVQVQPAPEAVDDRERDVASAPRAAGVRVL